MKKFKPFLEEQLLLESTLASVKKEAEKVLKKLNIHPVGKGVERGYKISVGKDRFAPATAGAWNADAPTKKDSAVIVEWEAEGSPTGNTISVLGGMSKKFAAEMAKNKDVKVFSSGGQSPVRLHLRSTK